MIKKHSYAKTQNRQDQKIYNKTAKSLAVISLVFLVIKSNGKTINQSVFKDIISCHNEAIQIEPTKNKQIKCVQRN